VKTLLDFGSGAGFPGNSDCDLPAEIGVTLAESQGKKRHFCARRCGRWDWNAEVWAGRVEEMANERVFDAVTLRAVDKMGAACKAAVNRLAMADGWRCLRR